MALPLPSSLPCSRLRPKGIIGLEALLSSNLYMEMELAEAVLSGVTVLYS